MSAVDLKDPQAFFKRLERIDLEEPEFVMVSGADPDQFDVALALIKRRLREDVGSFETSIYTSEPGDAEMLARDLFNIPLFAPYRLFVVRHGERILDEMYSSASLRFVFEQGLTHFPGRTLLMIAYEGELKGKSDKHLSIFHQRLLHLPTKELYSNQLGDAIHTAARRFHLHLNEEAVALLREQAPPRAGAIEALLQRLHDMLPEARRKEPLGAIELRDVLFPTMGVNPFALADALFAGDFSTASRELSRFHPHADNFFGILKVLLSRANEVRKAGVCLRLAMKDNELIDRLELKSRPPFIQKKILTRLKYEVTRFSPERLSAVYDLLLAFLNDFRSHTPPARQRLVFEERMLAAFFP